MEKMKAFYEKIVADSTLQEKIAEIMKAAAEAEKEAAETNLVALAREEGYDITPEELQAFFEELAEQTKGEISELELDKVAGGLLSTPVSWTEKECDPIVSCALKCGPIYPV